MRQRWARTAAVRAVCSMVLTLTSGPLVSQATAVADPDQAPVLPVFTPVPTDWSPHTDFWPYNTFTYQVTPVMVGGISDSCQWFDAQFAALLGQINDFNRDLAERHDVHAGVQAQADAVVADIDRATGFLGPRLQPLTIRNAPDNYGPYSPIYGGEQLSGVLFQLSRIADSMRKKQPAGFTRAHIDSAAGWGTALRNSGACI